MGIAAGHLRDRVKIQRKQKTRDSFGQVEYVWTDLAEVWAQVEPLRGREYLVAQQMQEAVDFRVRIRVGIGVKAADRFVWNDLNLEIQSAPPTRTFDQFAEFLCVSGVRDGRND